jgi:MFS family permease
MATSTRFPEIRDDLHLTNGTFGTILSLGSIGSLIAFLVVGHAAHKYGVKRMIIIGATTSYGLTSLVPHLHQGWEFLIVTIGLGFGLTAFHISDNAQAIHRQDQIGQVILPRLHGMWSLGALITSLAAIAITPYLSLAWHIDLIAISMWLATLYGIKITGSHFISKEEQSEAPQFSFSSLKKNLKLLWIISVGQIMALQIEFSINDWSTIYTRDTVKMSAALSVMSYAAFISAMILLRFRIQFLLEKFSEQFLMKAIPRIGGAGFVIFLLLGSQLARTHKLAGFLVSLLAFAFAGFGSSFLAPTFFGIAFRKSNLPSSLVVAQIGLINVVVTFFIKVIISWIAQATSVTAALMLPGVMLFCASLFAYLGNDTKLTKEVN